MILETMLERLCTEEECGVCGSEMIGARRVGDGWELYCFECDGEEVRDEAQNS